MTHPNVRAQSCEHVTHSVRKPWVHVVESSVMGHSLFLVSDFTTRASLTADPLLHIYFLGWYLCLKHIPGSPLVSSQVTWIEFICPPSLPPTRPLGNWEQISGKNVSSQVLTPTSINCVHRQSHTHTHTILHTCFPNSHNYHVILCTWLPDNSHFGFSFLYQSSSSCRNYLVH